MEGKHMVRHMSIAALFTALSIASTPAAAQDYRFAGFETPRGATATANYRIPLGARAKPSYGVSLSYGHTLGSQALDGRIRTRGFKLADLRFERGGKIERAELATLNLEDLKNDPRVKMNPDGSPDTLLIVGGVVVVGVIVLLVIAGGNDTCEPENCLF